MRAFTTRETMLLKAQKCKIDLENQITWASKLFEHKRFKICYGGRAGLKSWTFARALLIQACLQEDMFVLCAREYQRSINFSVHLLLSSTIKYYGLEQYFSIQRDSIRNKITNALFTFHGLKVNVQNIKSTPRLTHVWVEEASDLTLDSWEALTPTVRDKGAEIWCSFNPNLVTDVLYDFFITKKSMPEYSWVHYSSYLENPFLTEEIIAEAEYMKKHNPDGYAHVWLGEPKQYSDELIFSTPQNYVVEEFEFDIYAPKLVGMDFGSTDPFACLLMWIDGYDIYIRYEAYAHKLEINEIGALCESKIPNFKKYRIYADSSEPAQISYLKGQKYDIQAVKKGAGSVVDGYNFMKGYKIHVHPDCVHLIAELQLHKWKKDPKTNEILTIPIDKDNHCIDAVRYGLEKVMLSKLQNYNNIQLGALKRLAS
jgi:phage terminase large subunit